jgi:hypothetical protein
VPRKPKHEPAAAADLTQLITDIVDKILRNRRFRPIPARAAMSKREFAASVDLGISSVEKEIRGGRLEAKKIGYRTVITAAERERWLAALPSIEPTPSAAAEVEAATEARKRYLATRRRSRVMAANAEQRELSPTP